MSLAAEIRLARTSDISSMQNVERAAGELFAAYGLPEIAAHLPLGAAVLETYIQAARAWVAAVDDQIAGYALADIVDGSGHLEQVSVDPLYGRNGLGRRLIQTVTDWAATSGFSTLTLITFRDVPWNAPYYTALGFYSVPDEALTLGLRILREHETELGLDRAARQVMRMDCKKGA